MQGDKEKKTTEAREGQEAAAERDSCLPGLGPCLLEGLLLATLSLVGVWL